MSKIEEVFYLSVERGLSLLYGEVVSLDVLEDFLTRWSVYTQGERLKQIPADNRQYQQRTLVPVGDIQNFASSLQGLEKIEMYLHALKQGNEEDRLVAICILGESNLPETQEALVPFILDPYNQTMKKTFVRYKKKHEKTVDSEF